MKKNKCYSCEKGNLTKKFERYKREIGKNNFVTSDFVEYLECDNPECGAKIFLGKESSKLDATSVKNLLLDVLQHKKELNGDDIYFLRSFFSISARKLSLGLRFESSTVSNWESKNLELDFTKSIVVALYFSNIFKKKYPEFKNEIQVDALLSTMFSAA